MRNWIADSTRKPFVVAADSPAEALAFLSRALLDEDEVVGTSFANSIVVSTPEALRRVSAALRDEILIVVNAETERAASSILATHRVIIVRPRSSIENDPDISLEQIDDESFSSALSEMGFDDDEASKLKVESGHSPTILRRRLALSRELQFPAWAYNAELLRKLLPMLLAGAWSRTVEADKAILSEMSGLPYPELEIHLAELQAMPDSPVWAIGNYRGIVSRKDALFAARAAITQDDLDRFFKLAERVLSEDDPSLDLAPEERWAAGIHGKVREISGALRLAVGEMLVLLDVYGDQLFGGRVQSVTNRVRQFVSTLLKPSAARAWLSQRDDLPTLAEANPIAFLDAIDVDLDSIDPVVLAMLRPVESALFDSPDRSGLLWALEKIAWDSNLVGRVARILTKLSEVPINDNWANKPISSLESLVRAWFPQCGAPIEQRLALLENVVKQSPEVGWKLSLNQIDSHASFATHNARPNWRAAPRQPRVTRGEDFQMRRKALDLLLNWPSYDEHRLGDLIEHLDQMPDEDQAKVWSLCEKWLQTAPSDVERAALRERIRRQVRLRRRRGRGEYAATKRIEALLQQLVPLDLIARHQWLFADYYVPEAAGEIQDENFDFSKRDEMVSSMRIEAVREILDVSGFPGILTLLRGCNAWRAVGFALAKVSTDFEHRQLIIKNLLSEPTSAREAAGCLDGFLHALGDAAPTLITSFVAQVSDEDLLRLFTAAPFENATWKLLHVLRPDLEDGYWRTIEPTWTNNEEDMNILVERLIGVGRPRAAFGSVPHSFKKLESTTLLKLMRSLMDFGGETGNYRMDAYSLSEALKELNARKILSVAEMAQIEFAYIEALDHGDYQAPNLARQIAESPGDFVQLVSIIYKRSDGGSEPPEFAVSEELTQRTGTLAYRALHSANRIPGTKDDGKIDLTALLNWLGEARAQLKSLAREDVGESEIGTLLAKSPPGSDEIWPHETVRQALEVTGSARIARGMEIGFYNSRGVVWRGPGGEQERALAEKYFDWAKSVESTYPFTGRILRSIAENYVREAEWHDTDEAVRKRLGR